MSIALQRESIAEGVWFSCLHDSKFRHNSLSVTMVLPLEAGRSASAALVPCLLRMGSRDCPDMTELERRLGDLYGASLDAEVARHGEQQLLTLSVVGADDRFVLEPGEKISEGAAELLGEILFHPNIIDGAFPREMFEIEQQYLIDSIEAEINDKRSYAANRCIGLMGQGKRFSVSKFGTVEEAKAVNPQSAYERYLEILDTARIEIFFSGCGSPLYAEQVMKRYFSGLKRHPIDWEKEPLPEKAETVTRVSEEMEITQSKLVLGFRVGNRSQRKNRDALRLMAALLGGSTGSRLFTRVREKLGACYYCAARINLQTGIMLVDSGIDRKNREVLETAILEQIRDLAEGNITEEELTHVKRGYAGTLRSIGDSLGRMEGWYLTQLLRDDLISPEEDLEHLMKITKEEVAEAASALSLDTIYFLEGKEGEVRD